MDNIENNRKPNVRIKNPSVLTGDIGKVPPQATDIEQVVLGAMMLEKEALNDTINIITKDSFYDPRHQFIYGAMHDLFASTKPVDLITVTGKSVKHALSINADINPAFPAPSIPNDLIILHLKL